MSDQLGNARPRPRLAYLFSRFPYVSQTFTDNEMLALEARGYALAIASIFPPATSFRHAYLDTLQAELLYGPPARMKKQLEKDAKANGLWPAELIARHEKKYGPEFKAAERARNAVYYAHAFRRLGVGHVHVPFANRATHSMLFLQVMTRLSFSFTTHGSDFQVDLGSDELLREMCEQAEFVIAVCDYSRDLLRELCPDSASKIKRIYNGLYPENFPTPKKPASGRPLQVLSVGRLIEFKGFHILIDALAQAKSSGLSAELTIIGEGPWEQRLKKQAKELELEASVHFAGRRSQLEVRSMLQQSDVFALACTRDQSGGTDLLPTVITEAMFSSLPVISTRIAGVPEMISHGATGLLVEHGQPQLLAQALRQIAAMPDRGRAMGQNARAMATEKFHIDKTSQQLEQELAPCLDKVTLNVSATSPPPRLIAYYDLKLPDRSDWLSREWRALLASQAQILITAAPARWPSNLPSELLEQVEFLPDGIALDMEWTARHDWRQQLETLRTTDFAALDGTLFLRLARRATWLARKVHAAGKICCYTPGTEESFTSYLAAQIKEFERAVVFDPQPRWSQSQLQQIAATANAVNDGSGKLRDFKDPLGRNIPSKKRVHFGPFSFRVAAPSPPNSELTTNFENWLAAAVGSLQKAA